MLYFANKPDSVFLAILHEALEDLQRILTDPDTDPQQAEEIWKADYPYASECFSLALAVYTIDRLLAASKDPVTVYRITDYHWLLIYDCLHTYCEIHNDYAGESPERVFSVGPYEIGEIDFDAIVDHYFWDTDFLVDDSTMASVGPEGRQIMGVSDEAFGVSQRLVPHFGELRFEAVGEPRGGHEPLMEEPKGRRVAKYPSESDEED